MKEIPLTRGLTTLIDDEDFDWLSQWNWHAHPTAGGNFYARKKRDGRVFLHNLLITAPDGLRVDHRNANGLDNRRSNLRLATRQENGRNRKLGSNSRSGFKGVTWRADKEKWVASITTSDKRLHLGYFPDLREAAAAYDAAADAHFGEFAHLNRPYG